MANWTTLKAAITNIIKTNGNQEITGQLLQNALNNVVSAVGENATFVGVAKRATNPGVFAGPVFYLAYEPGVYANFNGVSVQDNELVVLYNDSSNTWVKSTVGVINPFEFILNLANGEIDPETKMPTYKANVMYLTNTVSQESIKSIKTKDPLVMKILHFDKSGKYIYTQDNATELICRPLSIYIVHFIKTSTTENIAISAEYVINNIEINYNDVNIEKITITDLYPFFIPNRYLVNSPYIERATYSSYNSCLSLKVKAGDSFSVKGINSPEGKLSYHVWDSNNYVYASGTIEPDSEIVLEKDGAIVFNSSNNYIHNLQISGTFNFFDNWNNGQIIPVMQNQLKLISNVDTIRKLEIDAFGIDIKNLTAWPDNMPLGYYDTNYTVVNEKTIPSTYMHSIEVTCSEGDRFIVSGAGLSNTRPYAFLDKNRVVLAKAETNDVINAEVIAPSGSAYLIVQSGSLSKTRISKLRVNQKGLKILCFGNSFTCDSMSYVPYVLKNIAYDVNLTLGIAFIGGCTLAQHLANFSNTNQSVDDKTYTPTTYTYYKSVNGKAWTAATNKNVDTLLADEDWDIITFQQESATAFKDWNVYYAPFIYKLHKLLFDKLPYKIKLGWILTHGAYGSNYSANLQYWQGIADNAKKMLDITGTSILFPYGTAVQNLRTTSLKAIGDGAAHNLMADNGHLQDGIGCMAAAYANTLTMLNCFGLNKIGVIGEKTRVDSAFITDKKIPGAHLGTSGVIGVTDDNCYLAQVAAECAVKNPYELTDLAGVESGI